MTTLTDRYTWAVVRSLPEHQRDDVARELRASIADMIDARTADAATDPDAAEHEVLAELGDPDRLAVGYAERPRVLVGPTFYPEYVRVLTVVVAVVAPLFVFVALLGRAVGEDVGTVDVVISAGVALMNGVVYSAFWVTIAFALAERRGRDRRWDPGCLPELPQDRTIGVGDLAASVVVSALTVLALVWQRVSSPFDDANGDPVTLLQESLWDGWMFVVIGGIVATTALEVLAYRAGGWTTRTAAANAFANLALLAVVAFLAFDDAIVNEVFLEELAAEAGWAQVPTVEPWLVVLVVGGVLAWDAVAPWRRARRVTGASA